MSLGVSLLQGLRGRRFLTSEVPLHTLSWIEVQVRCDTTTKSSSQISHRGTWLVKNTHPPRTTTGP
jgi:hypothetical protein